MLASHLPDNKEKGNKQNVSYKASTKSLNLFCTSLLRVNPTRLTMIQITIKHATPIVTDAAGSQVIIVQCCSS
jgi:hypothetical protein